MQVNALCKFLQQCFNNENIACKCFTVLTANKTVSNNNNNQLLQFQSIYKDNTEKTMFKLIKKIISDRMERECMSLKDNITFYISGNAVKSVHGATLVMIQSSWRKSWNFQFYFILSLKVLTLEEPPSHWDFKSLLWEEGGGVWIFSENALTINI